MFVAAAIVSVLVALVAIASATGKLTKNPKIVQNLTGLGIAEAQIQRIGLVELAGGVGVLAGLAVAPLGIAAGIGLVAYFAIAAAAHVRAKDTKGMVPALVIGLLAAVAVVLRISSM